MQIGTVIRNTRIDKDITQKELADMIPMNQSNYSKIERNIQEPNLFQLKRIAEILQISVDEMLGLRISEFTKAKGLSIKSQLEAIFDKHFNS